MVKIKEIKIINKKEEIQILISETDGIFLEVKSNIRDFTSQWRIKDDYYDLSLFKEGNRVCSIFIYKDNVVEYEFSDLLENGEILGDFEFSKM